MPKFKEIPVCPRCQSQDISCDGSAVWNQDENHWELNSTYESGSCVDCGEEFKRVDWIKVMNREILVFGSNLLGIHGAGAALHAYQYHGAVMHQGVGLQGESYGIPTKQTLVITLSLHEIHKHVQEFIQFANENQNMTFNVTRIGCGLAGYNDQDIAPMFKGAPENCILPDGWRAYH